MRSTRTNLVATAVAAALMISPIVIVLLAVLGTAIYIGLIEKHHGHASFPGTPISPN